MKTLLDKALAPGANHEVIAAFARKPSGLVILARHGIAVDAKELERQLALQKMRENRHFGVSR